MIKTPTYHVFNMYKYHQDAVLVDSHIETKQIGEEETYMVPNLTESVSVDKDGVMHITITNLSVSEDYEIETEIRDRKVTEVTGEILTNEMRAMNTFEDPEAVKAEPFMGAEVTDEGLRFTVPACSVLHLAVK